VKNTVAPMPTYLLDSVGHLTRRSWCAPEHHQKNRFNFSMKQKRKYNHYSTRYPGNPSSNMPTCRSLNAADVSVQCKRVCSKMNGMLSAWIIYRSLDAKTLPAAWYFEAMLAIKI